MSDLPLPDPHARRAPLDARTKLLLCVAVGATVLVLSVIVLRLLKLLMLFNVPTGAMTPAVAPGDRVFMEGITHRLQEPERGAIIVFRTDGLAMLPPGQFYVKRLVAKPGERVRVAEGKLFINEVHTPITNSLGEIDYQLPPATPGIPAPFTNATVPAGHYYVLGDNATNSYDSRFWGFLPATNVLGRVRYRYLPLDRIGVAN